jgi:hypothetical protein
MALTCCTQRETWGEHWDLSPRVWSEKKFREEKRSTSGRGYLHISNHFPRSDGGKGFHIPNGELLCYIEDVFLQQNISKCLEKKGKIRTSFQIRGDKRECDGRSEGAEGIGISADALSIADRIANPLMIEACLHKPWVHTDTKTRCWWKDYLSKGVPSNLEQKERTLFFISGSKS